MARLTTTTFGPGGPQQTTVDGTIRSQTIRSETIRPETIRSRTIRAVTQRASDQVAELESTASATRPALAGPGGTVRPLGAADDLPILRANSRGAIPVGGVVDYSGGVVNGREGASVGGDVARLEQRLLEVGRNRGALISGGDPADDETLGARYAQDFCIDSLAGDLYYWRPGTDAEDPRWELLATLTQSLNGAIAVPAAQQYPLIAVNDFPRTIGALGLRWINPNGSEGTPGAVGLLLNGVSASIGTEMEVDDYLALNVTDPGSGILAFTLTLTRRAR